MTTLNIEITDPAITQLGVEATLDFYSTLAFDEIEQKSMRAFVTGIDSPFLNVVIDSRVNPHTSLAKFDFFRNYFQYHSLPWSWFAISPGSNNSLHKYGFELVETTPTMYLSLANTIAEFKLDDFMVEEVGSNDDLINWILPLQEAFSSDDNCVGYRILNAKLLNQNEKNLKYFVGRYQGNIVSSVSLFFHHDTVMIHNLATKTAFLKRGFGTALSVYLLQYAKQHDYKHCFLESSADSFGIYQKLGFKICYITSIYQRKETS